MDNVVQELMLQLWCHETCRVYGDQMSDERDKEVVRQQVHEALSAVCDSSWQALFDATNGEVSSSSRALRQNCAKSCQMASANSWDMLVVCVQCPPLVSFCRLSDTTSGFYMPISDPTMLLVR
jgi:AAA+ lid domain